MVHKQLFESGFDRNQEPQGQVALEISGEVPGWLNGSFIRNGPGLFYFGQQRLNHWFDGLAMLHKFDFSQGGVTYFSRFLECHASKEALSHDQLTYSEFATDPCWGIFGRVKAMFSHGPTDSAKVNVEKVGERYFALGETTMQLEFDPETLETVSRYHFRQPKFGTSSTAHPHLDRDGAVNLITKYGPMNFYQVRRMDARASRIASILTFSPSYMHSFGMSRKHYVIAESPFTVQSIKLIAANRPFIENFKWDASRGTRIWVISRETGKVVHKSELEPFFFFHFVNTFDTSNGIAFDIVTYPDASVIDAYYLDAIADSGRKIPGGTLKRYALDFGNRSHVETETLSPRGMELPHMDTARYNMDPAYRYVYSPSLSSGESPFYDQLVKVDITTGNDVSWKEEGCFPGEPVFVPAPESAAEDDGILISLVLDARNGRSFLLLLDASNFSEVARVFTPKPVMMGFHGNFFQNQRA